MERNRKKTAIVIDANVFISSLIKYGGYTFKILRASSNRFDSFVPSIIVHEVEKHLDLISKKSGLNRSEIALAFRILLNRVKMVIEDPTSLGEALKLVYDKKDAPYVAVALKLRKIYEEVAILTFNKQDYHLQKLKKKGIIVLEPKEV